MKVCLFCGKELTSKWQNKYCNVSCQNKHRNPLRKKEIILVDTMCKKCGSSFSQYIKRDSVDKSRIKKYCSRKCANSRVISDTMKKRISAKLKGITKSVIHLINVEKICQSCGKKFFVTPSKNKRRFCSHKCANKISSSEGGKKSASKRILRSKNEIYFSELCKKEYNTVLLNKRMFNGWDADIILPDFNIAVLWNGKWHYEKIRNGQSLLQIQNRDKIKMQEIKKCGYITYVIKDMGRYKKHFVEKEFEKLKQYIAGTSQGG